MDGHLYRRRLSRKGRVRRRHSQRVEMPRCSLEQFEGGRGGHVGLCDCLGTIFDRLSMLSSSGSWRLGIWGILAAPGLLQSLVCHPSSGEEAISGFLTVDIVA